MLNSLQKLGQRKIAESKARATPAQSAEEQQDLDAALSTVARLRGQPDAAWALVAPTLNQVISIKDSELVAFKPYYDKLYGGSAAYRAYVAKLAPVR